MAPTLIGEDRTRYTVLARKPKAVANLKNFVDGVDVQQCTPQLKIGVREKSGLMPSLDIYLTVYASERLLVEKREMAVAVRQGEKPSLHILLQKLKR